MIGALLDRLAGSPREAAPAIRLPISAWGLVEEDKSYSLERAFTIQIWVRTNAVTDSVLVIGRKERIGDNKPLTQGFQLRLTQKGPELILCLGRGADKPKPVSIAPPEQVALADGAWHHLAAVYQAGVGVTLFTDEKMHADLLPRELLDAKLVDPPATLVIKDAAAPTPFLDIAEVRIWDQALEPGEVRLHARRRLSGDEIGLVAGWTCKPMQGPRIGCPNLVQGGKEFRPGHHAGVTIGLLADGPLLAASDAVPLAPLDEEFLRLEIDAARRAHQRAVEDLDDQNRALDAAQRQTMKLRGEIARQAKDREDAAERDAKEEAEILARHQDELDAFYAGEATPIAAVVVGLNKQIQGAREALQGAGAPFRLSRVSIELRGMPQGAGAGLVFASEDVLRSAESTKLSTLRAEFAARDLVAPTQQRQVEVPDIHRYTRGMAERKLAVLGLRLEARSEAIPAGNKADVDRVVAQDPPAGTKIETTQPVIASFGRAAQET